MKVYVLCEFSGVVREAFNNLGHDAWSCDLQYPEDGSKKHFRQDCLTLDFTGVDLIIAHPPCTYLCRSGARWWKGKEQLQEQAIQFFINIISLPVKRIAIENPIGVLSSRYGPPNQIVHPYYFGDPYKKATCLWLKNLPHLNKTKIVEPLYHTNNYARTIERSNERSRTFMGFAEAMAKQWGSIKQ